MWKLSVLCGKKEEQSVLSTDDDTAHFSKS